MSTLVTTRPAVLPSVNLLPPEIHEADRFRRVQLGLGAAVVAAVAVVGLLYAHAASEVGSAQHRLDASRATSVSLTRTEATYASVPATYNAVTAAQTALGTALGREVRWSYFLNDIAATTPTHVWLTNMQVAAPTGSSTTATAAGASTAAADVATVTFQGHALTHDDVAGWLDVLSKDPWFTNPTFTNSTASTDGNAKTVQFAGSANVTSQALSHRYDPTTKKAGS